MATKDKSRATAAKDKPADLAPTSSETALATVPDWAKEDIGKGTDAIKTEDMNVPRLAVAQKGSPQIDRDTEAYIPDLQLGEFFNTVSGTLYGEGPLEVVIVKVNGARAMEFDPDKMGAVLDFNVPLDDERCKFHGDEKPKATKFFEYVAYILETGEICMLSYKSKGLTLSKKFNGKLKALKVPLYMAKFNLSPLRQESPKGSYYLIKPEAAGLVQDEKVLRELKTVYDSLKDRVVDTNREGAMPGEDDSFNTDEM